jgi:UDP-N-acetyl-D-mannosaminuronic acid transferase (WecB/TagA/CpsF family)
LMAEPRRLWRRYLIGNSVFLRLILRQALGKRPPPLDA